MKTSKIWTKTLFLMLLFMLYGTSDVLATQLVRVYTTNGLEGGKDLKMHCKSKDDDLGEKLLAPGATWMFHFHADLFGRTLFFCRFTWDGIDYRYFDIYKQGRDSGVCDNCCWTIRSNGPCTCPCDRPCDLTFCTPWNKRKSLLISP